MKLKINFILLENVTKSSGFGTRVNIQVGIEMKTSVYMLNSLQLFHGLEFSKPYCTIKLSAEIAYYLSTN
jgi:hypothetical protein